EVAPQWSMAFVFAALASAGLPALSGFPGEFVTVLESFKVWGWWALVPCLGILMAAAYNLRMIRLTVQGEPAKSAPAHEPDTPSHSQGPDPLASAASGSSDGSSGDDPCPPDGPCPSRDLDYREAFSAIFTALLVLFVGLAPWVITLLGSSALEAVAALVGRGVLR
ncbi:MAG: hypothetical protein FWE94_08575, partial [Coriobacteriia bacterium]|nr:hypothetical protein [Coriobacteriia bacterium]